MPLAEVIWARRPLGALLTGMRQRSGSRARNLWGSWPSLPRRAESGGETRRGGIKGPSCPPRTLRVPVKFFAVAPSPLACRSPAGGQRFALNSTGWTGAWPSSSRCWPGSDRLSASRQCCARPVRRRLRSGVRQPRDLGVARGGDPGGGWRSGDLKGITGFKPEHLLGGIGGAAIVVVSLVTVRSLGATGVAAALVGSQLVVAALLDKLGVLGLDKTPLTGARVLGIALLILGTVLVTSR
jgi:Putative inner membrane exporter, YdcZ